MHGKHDGVNDGPFSSSDLFGSRSGGSGGPGGVGGPGRQGGPSRINWLYLLIACALLAYLFFNMGGGLPGGQTTEISTSSLVSAIEEDRVDTLTYTVVTGGVEGTLWTDEGDVGDESELVPFTSTYVGSDSLSELMREHPRHHPTGWTRAIPTSGATCS